MDRVRRDEQPDEPMRRHWYHRSRSWAGRLAEPIVRWIEDECPSRAASIAFYSAFSLAPALVIIIAVASFFYGADAVQGRLVGQVRGIIGEEGAAMVQAMIASAWRARAGTGTTLLSLAGIFVGASATFSSLNTALNRIWPLAAGEERSSLLGLLRVRLLSFGLVVGIGFLVVVLLVLDAIINFVGHWILGEDAATFVLANVSQRTISFAILAFAFGALLKLLPDARMYWRPAMIGGLAAALLFSIGKHLFALYLSRAGTANTFGAAGSLAVILMWLYFSAAVFLLGAEIAACAARHWRLARPAHVRGEQAPAAHVRY